MNKATLGGLQIWKFALRESYAMGLITEYDLIEMHTSEFYDLVYDSGAGINTAVGIVFDMMNNFRTSDDNDVFIKLMKDEVKILSKGIIPDDKQVFKKMWLSYLLDCLDGGYINNTQFDQYYSSIKFDGTEWCKCELEAARDVVDTIRLMLVHRNPKLIEFIENPGFDLLMYINDLEYL